MKIKAVLIVVTILITSLQANAQLTLEECYNKARVNYPSIKQFDLIEKSTQYNLSNANSGYLPQITLSAKASYQSEVTELPMSIPGVGSLKKDQYNATLEVSQSIWDGGVVHSKKVGIKSLAEIDKNNLEVELYSLNDRINQIYFGILLFDAQLEQNRLYSEDLQRSYDRVSNSIKNGVANKADLDAVKVEQLKSIQTKSNLTHSKTAYISMLSALIGESITPDTKLDRPSEIIDPKSDTIISRPELKLFEAQKKNYEIQNKQITAELMPKIGAFISGGYGRPGLNMLRNTFSPYYTAGAKLSWSISNFYNTKNSRRLIQNNIKAVDVKQNTFLFNTNIDINTKQSEILKYKDQLQYDDQIISLRQSVKQSSESKMSNGTISGIDLMRDVTAEDLAKQDKIYHEIELLLAIYNLKYVTNNF